MTEQQKQAVERAEQAFRAALLSGVHEDTLTDLVFEVTMGRDTNERLLKYVVRRLQEKHQS